MAICKNKLLERINEKQQLRKAVCFHIKLMRSACYIGQDRTLFCTVTMSQSRKTNGSVFQSCFFNRCCGPTNWEHKRTKPHFIQLWNESRNKSYWLLHSRTGFHQKPVSYNFGKVRIVKAQVDSGTTSFSSDSWFFLVSESPQDAFSDRLRHFTNCAERCKSQVLQYRKMSRILRKCEFPRKYQHTIKFWEGSCDHKPWMASAFTRQVGS